MGPNPQTLWVPAVKNHYPVEESPKELSDVIKYYHVIKHYQSSEDLVFSNNHFTSCTVHDPLNTSFDYIACRTFFVLDRKRGPVYITFELYSNSAAILIRQATCSEHYSLGWPRKCKLFGLMSAKSKLKRLLKEIDHWTYCSSFDIQKAERLSEMKLRSLDASLAIVNFRFGVTLVTSSDIYESDALAKNDQCTEQFDRFLHFLGEKISLIGWTGYAGGLDTVNGHTGSTSVCYKTKAGQQIMFHVGPLLASGDSKDKFLDRKRFIGNDIINIIFLDEGQGGFKLGSIQSKQTQCLVVVRMKSASRIGCNVFMKTGVINDLPMADGSGKLYFSLDSQADRERFHDMRTYKTLLKTCLLKLSSDSA